MKTIVEISTGKVLFATFIDVELLENQTAIEELLTENFENPHFDFSTRTFYDVPTEG